MADATWETDLSVIESYFHTHWNGATPVKYENRKFIQPGTQNQVRQPWVALYVREHNAWQANIGIDNPQRRQIGEIIVQIFTDLDIGTQVARGLAADVADIFRGATITSATDGTISCTGWLDGAKNTDPQIRAIGNEGNGWYQVNVLVKYRREDYF